MNLCGLAYRNIMRRKKRYILMVIGFSVSFAIITLSIGISQGVLQELQDKAGRYFGGHITITGYKRGINQQLPEWEDISLLLLESPLPIKKASPRTICYNGEGTLYYLGEKVSQRRLVGLDFKNEQDLFEKLYLEEGSLEGLLQPGAPTILISSKIAERLSCHAGDEITLLILTVQGQYNTVPLRIAGIYQETSLFAYSSYLDRQTLNTIIGVEKDFATDLALYVNTDSTLNSTAIAVQRILSTKYPFAHFFASREERDIHLTQFPNDDTLAILTQYGQLKEIKQIIDAFAIANYTIIVAMLVILYVGLSNTYKVLLNERRKEIGLMRALGTQKIQIGLIFVFETFFLCLVSLLAGFLTCFLFYKIMSFWDLRFLPGSSFFLKKGRTIPFSINVSLIGSNALIFLGITLLSAIGTSRKAIGIPPVVSLRSTL